MPLNKAGSLEPLDMALGAPAALTHQLFCSLGPVVLGMLLGKLPWARGWGPGSCLQIHPDTGVRYREQHQARVLVAASLCGSEEPGRSWTRLCPEHHL